MCFFSACKLTCPWQSGPIRQVAYGTRPQEVVSTLKEVKCSSSNLGGIEVWSPYSLGMLITPTSKRGCVDEKLKPLAACPIKRHVIKKCRKKHQKWRDKSYWSTKSPLFLCLSVVLLGIAPQFSKLGRLGVTKDTKASWASHWPPKIATQKMGLCDAHRVTTKTIAVPILAAMTRGSVEVQWKSPWKVSLGEKNKTKKKGSLPVRRRQLKHILIWKWSSWNTCNRNMKHQPPRLSCCVLDATIWNHHLKMSR